MQSRGKPAGCGSSSKAETRRRGIDQKILQARMAAGRPQLHDLEQADQDDGNRRRTQPSLGKRKAYCETDQDESQGVLTILSWRRMRTIARRPERREYDRRDQGGRADAEENFHRWRIAQFVPRGRAARTVGRFTSASRPESKHR